MSKMMRSLFHFVLENHMEDYMEDLPVYGELGQYAASQEQALRQNLSSHDWEIFKRYQGNRAEGQYQESLALFRTALALGMELAIDHRCK